MGGGLLQLVAYGAQDVYLTGNPQITFFKVVYRRHTNFSMESVKQSWSGNPLTGVAECLISRNGDLINGMHLEVEYTTIIMLTKNHIYINGAKAIAQALIINSPLTELYFILITNNLITLAKINTIKNMPKKPAL